MLNGTSRRSAATLPTNWPIRDTLKAVCLIVSQISSKLAAGLAAIARSTTPGPETPVLMATSPSEIPQKAPAINGLSSTALQNTTSFIAFCGLRMATSLTTVPINLTASMFKPLRVLPMFTDAQTRSVVSNTSGKLFINAVSAGVLPF